MLQLSSSLGQIPFPQAFERAQQAVPILHDIGAELRRDAGPQRLLTFSDLGTPEGPADWTEIERTFFRQNRDALVVAINEVNRGIDEFALRRQGAFPMVPPETPPEPVNVDTFVDQLDRLLRIYSEVVLGKKVSVGPSPTLVIAGLFVGFLGFATIVYLTQKDR